MPGKQDSLLWSFSIYLIVGLIAATVDFGVYYLLATRLDIEPLIVNLVSRPLGGLVCFYLNKRWTFRNRGSKSLSAQQIRFWCVFLMSLGLTEVLIGFFHHVLRFHEMVAKLASEAVAVIFNYVCLKFWTFK